MAHCFATMEEQDSVAGHGGDGSVFAPAGPSLPAAWDHQMVNCHLVGLRSRNVPVVRRAVEAELGKVPVLSAPNLDAVIAAPGVGLVILEGATAAEVETVRLAKDPSGCPRWAVVVLGTPPQAGIASVDPADWDVRGVRCAVRWALDQYGVRRDADRMAGDLRTIAHRISHDLRSPVSGIVSTGELINDLMTPEDALLTRPLFDSVQDILGLIEQVSFMLKATVDPQPASVFCMSAAFDAATQKVESRILRHGSRVQSPNFWPQVRGVESWCGMIWSNLLLAHLRRGGPGTPIIVGTRCDAIRARFSISDTDSAEPGEPFRGFHHLGRGHQDGDLDLAVVERLATLQGGTAGFLRAGSRSCGFEFTVPMAED